MLIKLLLLLLISAFIPSFGQDTISAGNGKNYLFMRTGDYLHNYTNIYTSAYGRNAPILLFNAVSDYYSPQDAMMINGRIYNNFPLGYKSVNLLPHDLLNMKYIVIKDMPHISKGGIFPSGGLDIITYPLTDTFNIKARLFTGSETGDPLIYTYTRNQPEYNRNKIIPSGAFTAEGGTGGFRMRLTGSYFGYFITGGTSHELMNMLSSYYTDKQNKQFAGILNTEYLMKGGALVSADFSLLSSYGWELLPSTASLTHSEFYMLNGELRFKNIIKGTELYAAGNSGSITVHDVNLIPGGSFDEVNYSIGGSIGITAGHDHRLTILPSFKIGSVKNPGGGNLYSAPHTIRIYGSGIKGELKFNDNLRTAGTLYYERFNDTENLISADAEVSYSVYDAKISLSAASVSKLPALFELYGNFIQYRSRGGIADTFRIKGSSGLRAERSSYAGIKFDGKVWGIIKFGAGAFINHSDNSITLKKKSDLGTEGIVYSGEYINDGSRTAPGFNAYINYTADETEAALMYRYMDVNPKNWAPRHSVHTNLAVPLLLGSRAELTVKYHSRASSDLPGIAHELFNVSISVYKVLKPFYFMEELFIKLEAENILNREFRTHPLSPASARTIIIYAGFSI